MVTSCMPCHGDKKQAGGVQLFKTAGAQLMFQPMSGGQPMAKSSIAAPVASGKMPRIDYAKGIAALDAQARQDLLTWLGRP